jgi:hypothetical protein
MSRAWRFAVHTVFLILLSIPAISFADTPVVIVTDGATDVAVREWLVASPLPSPSIAGAPESGPKRKGYDRDYLSTLGGEGRVRLKEGDVVALPDGKAVRFTPMSWPTNYIDLAKRFGQLANVCAYLYAEIETDRDREIWVHAGTNDAGKVWLGDSLIVAHPTDRGAAPSQHVVRIALKKGRTPLLLKVDQAGLNWGAFLEVRTKIAQERWMRKQYPRKLVLRGNPALPAFGDSITVEIMNHLAYDEQMFSWTVDDAGDLREISTAVPHIRFKARSGEPRLVTIRATSRHPDGSNVQGSTVVFLGGEEALIGLGEQFVAIQRSIGDPLALTGLRRDAYARILYAYEKLHRRLPVKSAHMRVGTIQMLLEAVECWKAGTDPYADQTGTFEAAYLSSADRTAQPFTVSLPESFNLDSTYILLVDLHGAGGTHERRGIWFFGGIDSLYKARTISIAVLGRGRLSLYDGLGEGDVMEAIRWMQSHYRIDPDRTYIRGWSMGGCGTWRMASRYPDTFAAAMADCGWPRISTLPKLSNLPTYINHGDADWVVPVAHSRLGVSALREMASPVVYNEYPGVNHGVTVAVAPLGYMSRMGSHVRHVAPRSIRIGAAHPRHGSVYWGRIDTWDDPHERAFLHADVVMPNTISVTTRNATRIVLTPPEKHLSSADSLVWIINGTRVNSRRGSDGYTITLTSGKPSVHLGTLVPTSEGTRSYVQGSIMELYRGEPLLIVYGTASRDVAMNDAIKRMATKVSYWLMPGSNMEFGSVPMVSDRELTAEQVSRHNLFLIGNIQQNRVTRRLMSRMQVRESVSGGKRVLDVAGKQYALDGRGYGFIQPNPEAPKRLIHVWASADAGYYHIPDIIMPMVPFRTGSRIIALSPQDPFIPDVIVEHVDTVRGNSIVGMEWFTHGWKLRPSSGRSGVEPRTQRDHMELVGRYLRRVAHADFALVGSAIEDAPCAYDPATISWEGIRELLPIRDVTVSDVTGKELLALFAAKAPKSFIWRNVEMMPRVIPSTIDTSRIYRLACRPEVLWSLARNPALNPDPRLIKLDAGVADAIAREIWKVGREGR